MLIRLRKNPPAASSDELVCLRDDGTTLRTAELPRSGVLPVLAVRLVVESTLGWNDGWFGTVANDGHPDEITLAARHGLIIANLLQAEQWSGSTSPDAFLQKLAAACATANIPPPEITAANLAALRASLRALGASWRPLGPGQIHETTWPERD